MPHTFGTLCNVIHSCHLIITKLPLTVDRLKPCALSLSDTRGYLVLHGSCKGGPWQKVDIWWAGHGSTPAQRCPSNKGCWTSSYSEAPLTCWSPVTLTSRANNSPLHARWPGHPTQTARGLLKKRSSWMSPLHSCYSPLFIPRHACAGSLC